MENYTDLRSSQKKINDTLISLAHLGELFRGGYINPSAIDNNESHDALVTYSGGTPMAAYDPTAVTNLLYKFMCFELPLKEDLTNKYDFDEDRIVYGKFAPTLYVNRLFPLMIQNRAEEEYALDMNWLVDSPPAYKELFGVEANLDTSISQSKQREIWIDRIDSLIGRTNEQQARLTMNTRLAHTTLLRDALTPADALNAEHTTCDTLDEGYTQAKLSKQFRTH